MRVCVHGLWHLGTVTAACLYVGRTRDHWARRNSSVVSALERCEPALYEPGLADLIRAGAAAGRLTQVSP